MMDPVSQQPRGYFGEASRPGGDESEVYIRDLRQEGFWDTVLGGSWVLDTGDLGGSCPFTLAARITYRAPYHHWKCMYLAGILLLATDLSLEETLPHP